MKTLISGCSYTDRKPWPSTLVGPNHKIKNVAKTAAGNSYIANSIMYNIDYKPDFVYILWSGINRFDLRTPNSPAFQRLKDTTGYGHVELGESIYFTSGHTVDASKGWVAGYNDVKLPEWPDITSLEQWYSLPEEIKAECMMHKIYLASHGGKENTASFCHQYFLMQNLDENRNYRSELTFQNLTNCFNMLEKHNIPYRFSFIYDLFSRGEYWTHGRAVKEKFYHMIDWSKFIDLPPYEYGIKHDLLDEDQYHLTDAGMHQWAAEINQILVNDPELKHLFDNHGVDKV